MTKYVVNCCLLAILLSLHLISRGQSFKPFVTSLQDTAGFHILPPYDEAKPPLTITPSQALEDISMLNILSTMHLRAEITGKPRG